MHPDLVPWKLSGGFGDWSAAYQIEDEEVINGEDGYSSAELLANLSLVLSALR